MILRRLKRIYRKLRNDPTAALRDARDRFDKRDFVQFGLRRAVVPFRVRHHSGPRRIAGGAGKPIVFCLLRNGMPWLEAFLRHHRDAGFASFVFLDNGSTDGTLSALEQEEGVTVLRSAAPYRAYENTLKRYLVDRFGRNRWCLFVDIDEQFDWPYRSTVTLDSLIEYLERSDANCMITQMLDMFSERAIGDLDMRGKIDFLRIFPFYELANIRRVPYSFGETAPIAMHYGGIRKALFGTDNGLTKVSFFRNDRGLAPFTQWHHVKKGRFADISGVLFHFPFEAGFAEKVRDAIATGRYGYHTTEEYVAYGSAGDVAQLAIQSENAIRFTRTDDLIGQGFVTVSDPYRQYADAKRRAQPVV